MFINPKSFFTSWAVQFIWLLEGPPREEIFPAALWVQTQSQEGNSAPHPSLPAPACHGLPASAKRMGPYTWQQLGTTTTPLPAPFAEGILQCPADSCMQSVEYFPNKGREGEGCAWPTAGCQFTKPAHLQRFCLLSLLLSAQTPLEMEE